MNISSRSDVDPAEVGFDADRLKRVDAAMATYVDDGKLPGWQLQISRHGEVAHFSSYGYRDVENKKPIEDDTVFRIYSMTKSITSVAVMALYEEGAFELTDPISNWIPSFENMQVYDKGNALQPKLRPAAGPITVQNLLNHTSGMTYGFFHTHVQDEMYRNAGYEFGPPPGVGLAEACDAWAALPLRFDPGTMWNYSVATDVLGRLVEIWSGKTLDVFMKERIFDPLDMPDTSFRWDEQQHGDRLATLYAAAPGGGMLRYDAFGDSVKGDVTFLGGGGGLISTTRDYGRFAEMLRSGGELDGARVLGSRTIDYMTRNSLPGGKDLTEVGIPLFAETKFDGVGFGLGFSVVEDAVKYGTMASEGEFGWGGLASTAFWVDPLEDVTVVFMTQLMPSSTYPIRTQLKPLIYQALVD